VTILSLVIPCFNEADNLVQLVEKCVPILERRDLEIIFVDNGSTDKTPDILPKLIGCYPSAKHVRVDVNQGYGFGILSGLSISNGALLAWTHADLQTDPGDVLRGLEIFYNANERPEQIFVKDRRSSRPLLDRLFTKAMTLFAWLVLGVYLEETNAQPTIFPRSFFEIWDDPPHDALLDLYAFYSAVQSGLKVYRFPVYFGERTAGKGYNVAFVSKLRFSIRNILYILKLRSRTRRRSK